MGEKRKYIVQAPIEYSMCTGCTSCEMVCGLLHDGSTGPSSRRLFFSHGDVLQLKHTIYTCEQCEDHPCYEACPKKDSAMCIDENGIVYVNEENCIGCGLCAKNCRLTPSRICMVKSKVKEERKAKKCDLCRNRPEGPACVQYCPAQVLYVNSDNLPWNTEEDKT